MPFPNPGSEVAGLTHPNPDLQGGSAARVPCHLSLFLSPYLKTVTLAVAAPDLQPSAVYHRRISCCRERTLPTSEPIPSERHS